MADCIKSFEVAMNDHANNVMQIFLSNMLCVCVQGVLSRASSSESSLRRNKRRAPPPPRTSPSLPDTSDKGTRYTIVIFIQQ